MESSIEEPSIFHRGKKNLTNQQRRYIVDLLLQKIENTKLKRGAFKEVADKFSVTPKCISTIWKKARHCIANGLPVDVSSNIPKRVGRKRVQIDFKKVLEIPLRRRTNIRSLAKALKVAQTTLHRRIKEGALRSHTNALKPYLTEEGKRVRLRFCLSMLEPDSLNNNPIFKDMYNYVHIDEKWFYLSKESERYYLLPEEVEPERTCKSKNFMIKVMFLAVVARPRYDLDGNEVFSGKIGIFPFVYQESARRKSKNRAAGTVETKSMTSVTKDIIRSYMIEKVLPAIRAKWPRGNDTEIIYIQQDNARPHINHSDFEFLEAARMDGFDIRLSNQPPNSPDMIVLDLGYFNAIQSLQHQEAPTTIDELVRAVERSFEALSFESLNCVFLSLQACMIEVMKAFGGNRYKLPHIGKIKMRKDGNLPNQLQCDRVVVETAISHLQTMSN